MHELRDAIDRVRTFLAPWGRLMRASGRRVFAAAEASISRTAVHRGCSRATHARAMRAAPPAKACVIARRGTCVRAARAQDAALQLTRRRSPAAQAPNVFRAGSRAAECGREKRGQLSPRRAVQPI